MFELWYSFLVSLNQVFTKCFFTIYAGALLVMIESKINSNTIEFHKENWELFLYVSISYDEILLGCDIRNILIIYFSSGFRVVFFSVFSFIFGKKALDLLYVR